MRGPVELQILFVVLVFILDLFVSLIALVLIDGPGIERLGFGKLVAAIGAMCIPGRDAPGVRPFPMTTLFVIAGRAAPRREPILSPT